MSPALQAIATSSGGQYFEVTKAMIDATTSPASRCLKSCARSTRAIQHAFVQSTTFNTAPTPALPFGPLRRIPGDEPDRRHRQPAGRAASSIAPGAETLPDSETDIFNGDRGDPAAFERDGDVRASRCRDSTGSCARFASTSRSPIRPSRRATGSRRTGRGCGSSSTPAAGSRNIYTVLPGSTTMVPFDAAPTSSTLDDYLRRQRSGDADRLDSQPAARRHPRLDAGVPRSAVARSAAGRRLSGFREDNKDRRSLIFVGANDGMLHAIDARTGVEVWAFIPFNLLPKLQRAALRPVARRLQRTSSTARRRSPTSRSADDWRTYLFFGQGPGGTFYNALDVTLDGHCATRVAETSTNDSALLDVFRVGRPHHVEVELPAQLAVSIATLSALRRAVGDRRLGASRRRSARPGRIRPIGQVHDEDGPYVMVAGSGFLKYSVAERPIATRRDARRHDVLRARRRDRQRAGTPRDVGADTLRRNRSTTAAPPTIAAA